MLKRFSVDGAPSREPGRLRHFEQRVEIDGVSRSRLVSEDRRRGDDGRRGDKKRSSVHARHANATMRAMAVLRLIAITDGVALGGDSPPLFIAGPCVIESRQHAIAMGRTLRKLRDALKINLVYKSSFDKANRSSIES